MKSIQDILMCNDIDTGK